MNQENNQNAERIIEILTPIFPYSHKTFVLDICCGVFSKIGTNYDQTGSIYEAVVANYLGKNGYLVTGIDTRENDVNVEINYTHTTSINILEEGWQNKLHKNWDVVIFLRSWDTPEILLFYQKLFGINKLNELSLAIANYFIPQFASIMKTNGIFFTTDVCNFGLCETKAEIDEYQEKINALFRKNKLILLSQKDGLSWYKKITK